MAPLEKLVEIFNQVPQLDVADALTRYIDDGIELPDFYWWRGWSLEARGE
jgi:hypothetical protein